MDDMKTGPVHTKEFEIDLRVEDLIGKLIDGVLTSAEEAKYNQLLAQRSRMMRSGMRYRRRVAA